MKPVEKVLGRLEGVVESSSSWKALCSAHDDVEPSLSVSEADDGRTLIKCFAGCEATEIVAELGLEMGDLFERRNGHRKTLTLPPETTLLEARTFRTPTPQREGSFLPYPERRCRMGP
jgi:hypothetical protein